MYTPGQEELQLELNSRRINYPRLQGVHMTLSVEEDVHTFAMLGRLFGTIYLFFSRSVVFHSLINE
jgi:hypothetical protein